MEIAFMTNEDIEKARYNMVEQQIRTWDVLDDKILDLIREVRREQFVPDAFKSLAFADLSIPLAHDQEMLPPKLEARILQTLHIQPQDSLLEVGTGSGFLTACLAMLASKVHSIDYYENFLAHAVARLESLGLTNASIEQADFYSFLQKPHAFDVVVVSGSIPVFDDRIQKLLAIGGRLFLVVGMEALLIERIAENEWKQTSLFETQLCPLIHAKQEEKFHF